MSPLVENRTQQMVEAIHVTVSEISDTITERGRNIPGRNKPDGSCP